MGLYLPKYGFSMHLMSNDNGMSNGRGFDSDQRWVDKRTMQQGVRLLPKKPNWKQSHPPLEETISLLF